MAENDMKKTEKVVEDTFKDMDKVVDENVNKENDVQQPGPGVDETEKTQQEKTVQSEADKGKSDTEAVKPEADKNGEVVDTGSEGVIEDDKNPDEETDKPKTDTDAGTKETDKKEGEVDTGATPKPGAESPKTDLQGATDVESDKPTEGAANEAGADTQSPGENTGADGDANTGDNNSTEGDENVGGENSNTNDTVTDPDSTDDEDEKDEVDAGEIYTKAKEIIKRNNNFGSILPGRHFKDKISEKNMKLFYEEFVSYGASTTDEVELMKLFEKMFA